jgi:hypothetical protein
MPSKIGAYLIVELEGSERNSSRRQSLKAHKEAEAQKAKVKKVRPQAKKWNCVTAISNLTLQDDHSTHRADLQSGRLQAFNSKRHPQSRARKGFESGIGR